MLSRVLAERGVVEVLLEICNPFAPQISNNLGFVLDLFFGPYEEVSYFILEGWDG